MVNKFIAFHVYQYTYRGTGTCTFDYAYYNQTILKNKSYILAPVKRDVHDSIEMIKKFSCFETLYYNDWNDVEKICIDNKIDAVYIIKYGNKDKYILKTIPTFIHCVFTTEEPHGSIYAGVSDSVSEKNRLSKKFPIVNHIVKLPNVNDDYRKLLDIPEDAIVFGRHGGEDTFDILFVKNVILNILSFKKNIYFLFAVRPTILKDVEHSNIIYIESFADDRIKRKFINTCDAMLDACSLGQSFGLSILEFSYCNKPVITWNGGRLHDQHLRNLGNKAVKYNNENELYNILNNFNKTEYKKQDWKIDVFSPEYVMNQFNSVFLSILN